MNKEIYVIKLPHGWFKGKIKMTDIIDTIDAGINNWHTLIGETNETPQREREFLSRMRPRRVIWKLNYMMA